jgi:MFS family permease
MMTTSSERRDHWRLAALALAMLLPSMSTSIANVALPTLAVSFSVSLDQVQWVVLAYLLATTALIVGAGRLGDTVGPTRLLLAGIALFTGASLACGLAPSLWVLVVARAAQGMGAAVMMALTVALVRDLVSKERTGSAMGLLGTVSAIGTALGPSLGGALIATWGWPSVFLLMAVAGALAFLVGTRLFPADRALERKVVGLDPVGTALLAVALGAYALTMTLGGSAPWPLSAVLVSLILAGVIAFAGVERRVASPLIHMDLLGDRAVSAGLASVALISTVGMTTLVVGPFYLSGVLGLDAATTGLVMSVGPGIAALVGVPAGRLVDRLGPFRASIIGLGSVATGSTLMVLLPAMLHVCGYLVALAILTAGYALFQAANNTAIMQEVSPEQRGVTAALLGLARNLGLITGASAMGALFALGSRGLQVLQLRPGGETGMGLTFAVAAALAGLALLLSWWARERRTNANGYPAAVVDQGGIE